MSKVRLLYCVSIVALAGITCMANDEGFLQEGKTYSISDRNTGKYLSANRNRFVAFENVKTPGPAQFWRVESVSTALGNTITFRLRNELNDRYLSWIDQSIVLERVPSGAQPGPRTVWYRNPTPIDNLSTENRRGRNLSIGEMSQETSLIPGRAGLVGQYAVQFDFKLQPSSRTAPAVWVAAQNSWKQISGNLWHEFHTQYDPPRHSSSWEELSRVGEVVTLRDASRGYQVRLKPDCVEILFEKEPNPAFAYYIAGKWDVAPGEAADSGTHNSSPKLQIPSALSWAREPNRSRLIDFSFGESWTDTGPRRRATGFIGRVNRSDRHYPALVPDRYDNLTPVSVLDGSQLKIFGGGVESLLANNPKRDVTWEYFPSFDKLPELAIAVGQLPSGELIYPLTVRISHEIGARGDSYSQFAGAYTWEGLQGLYFLDQKIVKQRPGLQPFGKETRILVESSR